jgi:hypothetical protein
MLVYNRHNNLYHRNHPFYSAFSSTYKCSLINYLSDLVVLLKKWRELLQSEEKAHLWLQFSTYGTTRWTLQNYITLVIQFPSPKNSVPTTQTFWITYLATLFFLMPIPFLKEQIHLLEIYIFKQILTCLRTSFNRPPYNKLQHV